MHINWKKYHLLKGEVEFLGHITRNGQIYPSEHKTMAVLRFPMPTTQKQLQSFLDVTGYFRKFIPKYSTIARPLSELLKGNKLFTIAEEQRAAFEKLKKILANKPVLNIYQQGRPTELHCASQEGYGAVLLQKSDDKNKFHPIY